MTQPDARKTFVLDTNVLLHNPDAFFVFQDNNVVIPFEVIEELDKFKANSGDDLGRNARRAIRHLDGFRKEGNLSQGVPIEQTGGTIRVMVDPDLAFPPGMHADKPDNHIIATAWHLQQQHDRVVFISKDINARIKSDSLGIKTEDFENQKVDFEKLYTGYRDETVKSEVIDELYKDKALDLPLDPPLLENEFVLLHDVTNESHTAIARQQHGRLSPMKPRRSPVFGITHRNLQQQMALDLLLDDSVRLVSLIGTAGTGKTMLALAAGMSKLMNEKVYDKLLVARPIMPLGRDIGYLPGDKDEKLGAWMQPIFDNLSFLFSSKLNEDGQNLFPKGQHGSVESRIQGMMTSGQLVLEPLTYIRGRSIPNQYMIVDEAQNLTPHEVKTIASRVGDGTKLVLTGDATQIDNPYLDSSSNGLSYLVERLKNQTIVGHITLLKAERSELARLVTDIL